MRRLLFSHASVSERPIKWKITGRFFLCNFIWKYNDTAEVSIDKLYRVALSQRSGLINIAALSYLTFIDTENDNDVWTALYSQEMKNIADYALSFSNIDICWSFLCELINAL